MTVSGHDQPQGAILGQVSNEGSSPQIKGRTQLQLQRGSQLSGLPTMLAIADMCLALQYAYPGPSQTRGGFGQPTSGVQVFKGDELNHQTRLGDLLQHLPGQFGAFAILPGRTAIFRTPQAKGDRNTPTPHAEHNYYSTDHFDTAFSAGRVDITNPGALLTKGLAQYHFIHHQITAAQVLRALDHLRKQSPCRFVIGHWVKRRLSASCARPGNQSAIRVAIWRRFSNNKLHTYTPKSDRFNGERTQFIPKHLKLPTTCRNIFLVEGYNPGCHEGSPPRISVSTTVLSSAVPLLLRFYLSKLRKSCI